MSNLKPIERSYLLCLLIPIYYDQSGNRYLDYLWYKDLIEHLNYLKNFTLLGPVQKIENSQVIPGLIAVDQDPLFAKVKFVELPPQNSLFKSLITLPKTLTILWKAIKQSDIVHTGVAGWPIPLAWLITPMIIWQRKFYIVIVESAFWRLLPGQQYSVISKVKSQITESINRWCLNQTDLAIFTQEEYKQSLLKKHQEKGYIINASWIDQDNIISDTESLEIWDRKMTLSTPKLKAIFVGRLGSAKGVLVLLEALRILDNEGIALQLDILGEGDLLAECKKASQEINKSVVISVLGTVAYGKELFSLLQNYHVLVVPSISDEQPRIVYDGYSQAIPSLASNTNGLRDCIKDGETGILIEPGNPIVLAEKLKWCLNNLNELKRMGQESVKVARTKTHTNMHQQRWQILDQVLPK